VCATLENFRLGSMSYAGLYKKIAKLLINIILGLRQVLSPPYIFGELSII